MPGARSPPPRQAAAEARLAHEGLSNPEISPRTVEYHLGKVFTKLGIGSRTELGQVLPGVVGDVAQMGRRRPWATASSNG
jgi:hypothetical protein